MRPLPESIFLGPHQWLIRPLTLAQVQEIEPILMKTRDSGGNVSAAIAIVSIALSRDHAAAVAGLVEIEATTTEIATAMTAVLRLGGFIQADVGASTTMGEADADVITAIGPSA